MQTLHEKEELWQRRFESKATMGNVKQLKYGALNKTSQMDM